MKVIEDIKGCLPPEAHESDFDFVKQVIRELDLVPTKNKVVFPLESRGSQFADIECTCGYDDAQPYGEFAFVLRHEDMQMAHTAVVTTVATQGQLHFKLTIRPPRKLRNAGHRNMVRVLPTAKTLALAMCNNYFPGSAGRKIVIIPTNQPA